MTPLEAGEFLVENFDHFGPLVTVVIVAVVALYYLGKKVLSTLEKILKQQQDEIERLHGERKEERRELTTLYGRTEEIAAQAVAAMTQMNFVLMNFGKKDPDRN